jgi:hypothetical protein
MISASQHHDRVDRSVAITMIIGFILLTVLVGLLARLVAWLGRPTVPTGPSTPELLDTPPAVVNLMMSGLAGAPEAGAATLLDLAARGVLELHQPGADPEGTTVTVRRADPAGLTAYERRVLQRVTPPRGVRPFTLADLDRRHAEDGHEWHARVLAEVRQDATDRGLVLAGGQSAAGVVLMLGFVGLTVLSCLTGFAIMEFLGLDERMHPIAQLVGMGVFVLLLCAAAIAATTHLAGDVRGARLTPEGRRVAGHWAGVATWLRAHEAFADLPPASVTVWDRYIAHGVALGASPRAAATVDLRAGQVDVVRSTFGGAERLVQVRYPRSGRTRWNVPAGRRLIMNGTGLALLAVLTLLQLTRADALPTPVLAALGAVAAVLALRCSYRTVRAASDLARPVHITGQVIRIVPFTVTSAPQDGATATNKRPLNHHPWSAAAFLVVDDGRSDTTRAWWITRAQLRGIRPGSIVTVRAQPWTACLSRVRPGHAVDPITRGAGRETIGSP